MLVKRPLFLFIGFFVFGTIGTTVCASDETRSNSRQVEFFDRTIAPLLTKYCLDCHTGSEPKGELDLSGKESALKGGQSGTVLQPGVPEESLLWLHVESGEMPPEEKLPVAQRQLFRQWIADGAAWGTDPIDRFRYTTAKRGGLDWWSLQPLRRPEVPRVDGQVRVRNPIDAFLLEKLEAKGLTFSPDADPRALVRRLYFNLIGLPPSPEEVAHFVREPTEVAYRALVERLLARPEHGERWGRHWLDVARFGESDGFERNSPRKSFWHYRDWVIQALNDDMPYDRFARMQIAGDVITDGSPDGLAAVGFLVAGVHNTVVGSSERMRLLAREDELEEIVGTVGQTFVGLTLNCARCHDHKFDPIRQEEYYRLTSSLSGVRHGEKSARRAEHASQLAALAEQIKDVSDQISAIETKAREKVLAARKAGVAEAPKPPEPVASWEFDADFSDGIGSLHAKAVGGARLEKGGLVLDGTAGYVETAPLPFDLNEKTLEAWVMLDNPDQRGGGVISVQTTDGKTFDAIVFGEREPRQWMAGSDSFARTQSFSGPPEEESDEGPVHVAIVYDEDGTITGYRNGVPYGQAYQSKALQSYDAESTTVLFGLRHHPAAEDRLLRGRILRARLYDRALSPAAVAASAGIPSDYVAEEEMAAHFSEQERVRRKELLRQENRLSQKHAELDEKTKLTLYTVTPDEPGATHLLNRGDVGDVGPVVAAGAVEAVAGVQADFGLKPDAPEARRRLGLADWIADRSNPLFARVLVNRLWHYHFGTGIVETPNDLGFNGGRPSHPELLDWLANQLKENGYRLKPIHRLIVTSRAYRQSARFVEPAHRVDSANRLLWRMSPHRLEAEVLRDSILQVSGKLSLERGGPGFEDVTITYNNGTTYYTPFDRENEQFNRRTIYRFWPRGGRSALLDTFDCPDPSATAPRRSVTTTPLQALSLLNNAFVLRMVDHFAERVRQEGGDDLAVQVGRAYQLAYNRDPDAEERALAVELVSGHGLFALCRALFNSNEFVMVQ